MLSVVLLVIGVILLAAAYKSRLTSTSNGNYGVSVFDDFIAQKEQTPGDDTVILATYFRGIAKNGGRFSSGAAYGWYPGAISPYLSPNGTDVPWALVTSDTVFDLNISQTLDVQTRILFRSLPDNASDGSVITTGMTNGTYVDNPIGRGAVFVIDRSISNYYICRVYNGGDIVGQVLTNVRPQEQQDTYLRIIVQRTNTGGKTLFYINDVLVATIPQYPLPGMPMSVFSHATSAKDASATSYAIDAFLINQKLVTPRKFKDISV